MAEITSEQIVKIVIAVFVLVVVLGGVYLLFKDKILSYFGDLTPKDNRDFSSPYYKELLENEKNLVATLTKKGKLEYISLKGGVETNYYIDGKSVKLDDKSIFSRDKKVGILDKQFKIRIDSEYLNGDDVLTSINGAEKIGKELRKLQNE